MPVTKRSTFGFGRFFSSDSFAQEFVGGGKFNGSHARALGDLIDDLPRLSFRKISRSRPLGSIRPLPANSHRFIAVVFAGALLGAGLVGQPVATDSLITAWSFTQTCHT
jgi:hypothetical protein